MSRFTKAVHYVIANCEPEKLGKTKLAKVLFFADVEAFRHKGQSITGMAYEKRSHGPMPRDLYSALKELIDAGAVAQRDADYFGYHQHQFWAMSEPDVEEFTATDVAILTRVARVICDGHTAASISEYSHNPAWTHAADGEVIPIAAFLAASREGHVNGTELAMIEARLGN